jgi:hypothetical protein
VLISLEMLNKPVVIFLPLLYIIYFYKRIGSPTILVYLKKLSPMVVGMALTLSPWMLFINHEKNITIKERADWSVKILASMETPLSYESIAEVGSSSENTVHALKNFVKYIYVCHTQQEGDPIMITNQFRKGLSLMFLNNEFCVNNLADMGSFGWLWKTIRTSYYNTHHLSSSNVMKVFYFYKENPCYIYEIPAVRLKFSVDYPLIFWLAFGLWSLAVIYRRILQMKNILLQRLGRLAICFCTVTYFILAFYPLLSEPLYRFLIYLPSYVIAFLLWEKEDNVRLSAYPILWLSIFFFIVIVYGDQRFTKALLAVNCIAIALYTYTITKGLIRNKVDGFVFKG